MNVFISVTAPYKWVWYDEQNTVVDNGVAENLSDVPFPDEYQRIIGVAPFEAISMVQTELPVSNQNKAQDVAAFSIEDYIAEDVDDVHVVITDWNPSGASVLAVIDRNVLTNWLDEFKENEIRLDALYPSQSLIPNHDAVDATVLFVENGAYVRADKEYSFISDDLLPTWLIQFDESQLVAVSEEGRINPDKFMCEFRLWPVGNDFVSWLRQDGKVETGGSLLIGSFKPPSKYVQFPNWRQAKIAVAVVLALAFLPILLRFTIAAIQEMRVNSKAKEAITFLDENAEITNDPVGQLRQLVFQSQKNSADYGGYAYILTRVGQRFPQNDGSITDLDFSEGGLTMTIDSPSLASVENIQNALSQDEEISIEVISQQNVRGKASAIFRLRPRGI